MKFSKEFMQDLAFEDHGPEVEVIKKDLVDTSRWSNIYDLVFKFEGKFYASSYSVGATECQDERPYENDGDEIECDEVAPVEKVVIVYEKVKPTT